METIDNKQIIPTQSTAQSPQVYVRNNNEVLIKRGKPLSVFGFHMPASREFIAIWTKKLSIAFPNKPSDFWGLVAQKAMREALSEQRLEYIYDELCDGRKVFDISDIFTIDRTLKKWANSLNKFPPYKPFACVKGTYFMTIEEAEQMGVNYELCEMDNSGCLIKK